MQLLTAPKTAYRHVSYHRQTKLCWARDDPAFALALAGLTAGIAAAHGLAFGGLAGAARAAARGLVLDFGLVGVLAAMAGWAASAATGGGGEGPGGRPGGGAAQAAAAQAAGPAGVEWLYAFDVHCNAALAAVLEVGALGYLLSPWMLRPGAVPALAAATLYGGACVHYCFLTCLGFSAAGPSAARSPEWALYPGMAAAVLLPLAALLGGWNVARGVVGLLYGRR